MQIELWQVLMTVGIWAIGGICVAVMHKIEPDDKIYPIWALFTALMFTAFAVSQWLGFVKFVA